MSRKHLFAIVVLLGAAAVAGVSALTRTTTAATQAAGTDIAAKSRSLDRLEASLRRSLAEQPPAVPQTGAAVDSAPTRTVFVRSSARPKVPAYESDYEYDDDHAYEHEDEHEDGLEDGLEGADD